jgi:FG-GAP repeat protein
MNNDKPSTTNATLTPSTPAIQKVVASDGGVREYFGSSVAVSGDIAVIGAPFATVNGNEAQGAVYIFKRVGGIWTQTQKLVASDGATFDEFGQAIALFEGKTIVITAPLAKVNGHVWAGAAYVFNLAGGSWVEKQKLAAADATTNGTFGKSIALTASYALIGAGGASTAGVHILGSIYVFNLVASSSGGTWNQTQRIAAHDPNDDTAFFGGSVAISGGTALVGAYASTVAGNPGQGLAYVYKLVGGIWGLAGKIVASDGAMRDNFGVSIALQGKTAFIGAPGAAIHGNISQGAVYRFEETGSIWTQTQKLIAPDGTAINLFGASVNFISSNVLVGAYAANSYTGAAYIFSRSSSAKNWTNRRKLTASDGQPHDVFGYHTALDRNTALVSAWGADIGSNSGQGAAYLFKLGAAGPSPI